jgi:hypothetical protein
MMNDRSRIKLTILGLTLFLSSIACQALFPKNIAPGSFEAQVASGNMTFTGTGNITYIGCQDPTAAVSLHLGAKTREINGTEFNQFVNSVSVNAITEGTQIKMEECQKTNQDEKYDWPAKGIYYPDEGRILFTSCTQNDNKAEGEGFLVGEGFEGEYTCYAPDGGLMFSVAFSAYGISK